MSIFLPVQLSTFDKIKNEGGISLYSLAITNPRKYAFPYIITEIFLRFKLMIKTLELKRRKPIINIYNLDSLESQKRYVEMLYSCEILDVYQYKVYKLWYQFFETKILCFEEENNNFEGVYLSSIDGNISSGKSTIISKIKEMKLENLILVQEPTEAWEKITDNNGVNILEAYYQNPEKFAFTFQIMALFTRYTALLDAFKSAHEKYLITNSRITVLIERTILTDYHIFAKMLHDSRMLNTIELKVYEFWFSDFYTQFPLLKCVYLRSNPNICFERIKIRNRDGEDKIPISYLEECNAKHEIFYSNVLTKHDCMIFNGDEDMGTFPYSEKIKDIIRHLIV